MQTHKDVYIPPNVPFGKKLVDKIIWLQLLLYKVFKIVYDIVSCAISSGDWWLYDDENHDNNIIN